MKKVYIAGPDVFEKNSIEIGRKLTSLCEKYGYIALYPMDNIVDFSQTKHKIADDIFLANRKMIQDADIVIANLNSFRGKESDSGTVWECGYAYALGKKVYGYLKSSASYIEQFPNKIERDGMFWDEEDRFIEDFEHPVNLMIASSCEEIIAGDFEDVLKKISGS
jgi:nucleoside 2-deoxyribosyltransferase